MNKTKAWRRKEHDSSLYLSQAITAWNPQTHRDILSRVLKTKYKHEWSVYGKLAKKSENVQVEEQASRSSDLACPSPSQRRPWTQNKRPVYLRFEWSKENVAIFSAHSCDTASFHRFCPCRDTVRSTVCCVVGERWFFQESDRIIVLAGDLEPRPSLLKLVLIFIFGESQLFLIGREGSFKP